MRIKQPFSSFLKIKPAYLLIFATIGILVASVIFDPCRTLDNSTFRAVHKTPVWSGGTMHRTVSFSSGTFSWLFDDFPMGGTYVCAIGMITADSRGRFTGLIVPILGVLIWGGDIYTSTSASGVANLLVLIVWILIILILVVPTRDTPDGMNKS